MSKKKESWTPLLKDFPESRKINSVSVGAETMFIRLLARCDDRANYYGESGLLLCHLYGRRFTNGEINLDDMQRWRDELVTATLLILYVVDGEHYVHVANCKKMLRSDIKADERFPDVSEGTQVVATTGVPENVTGTGRGRDGIASSSSSSASPSASPSPTSSVGLQSKPDRATQIYADIRGQWNNLPEYCRIACRGASKKRLTALRSRLKDEQWQVQCDQALLKMGLGHCGFFGDNDRGWKPNIEWFLKPDSVLNILEGKYDKGQSTMSSLDAAIAEAKRMGLYDDLGGEG